MENYFLFQFVYTFTETGIKQLSTTYPMTSGSRAMWKQSEGMEESNRRVILERAAL